DHDLTARRELREIALEVDLALLALRGGGQGDGAKHARADAFGDALDHTPFAGGIATLEQNNDLGPGVLDPELQLDEFSLQALQLLLVGLAVEAFGRRAGVAGRVFALGFVPVALVAHAPDITTDAGKPPNPICKKAKLAVRHAADKGHSGVLLIAEIRIRFDRHRASRPSRILLHGLNDCTPPALMARESAVAF